MVSNTRVKTPTAAAALLIDNLLQVLTRIDSAQQRISMAISQRFANQKERLSSLQTIIPVLAQRLLSNAKHRLELIELQLQGYAPQLLLRRGYSITLHNGRAVRDPNQLKTGDEIETRLEKGTIHSVIKN